MLPRYAARKDNAQGPIVDGLCGAGYEVFIIERPCDLLVYSPAHNRWQTFEVKTPRKSGKRIKRYDQAKQEDFLARTHTPVLLTVEQAIKTAYEIFNRGVL